jgi:site-specific DNA-methyltransferase (adenine-specific)
MNLRTELVLHNQDCVEGMQGLPPSSIDICVTSPPYNLDIAYSKYDDSHARADYLAWTRRWITEVHRLLSDDSSFFLNLGSSPSNPMLPHEVLITIRDLFVLQNTIHWIKSITVETKHGLSVSAGHFKPINSRRYLTDCHEFIFHLTKSGNTRLDRLAVGVPYADKSNIARWSHTNGQDKRCRGNTWFIPYDTIHSRAQQRPHPATFPTDLPKMCIQLHGRHEGLVMLDPFLGIGSSALAALEAGVAKFIGFEIDSGYFITAGDLVQAHQSDLLPLGQIVESAA